jgi:hypothetical protein
MEKLVAEEAVTGLVDDSGEQHYFKSDRSSVEQEKSL